MSTGTIEVWQAKADSLKQRWPIQLENDRIQQTQANDKQRRRVAPVTDQHNHKHERYCRQYVSSCPVRLQIVFERQCGELQSQAELNPAHDRLRHDASNAACWSYRLGFEHDVKGNARPRRLRN